MVPTSWQDEALARDGVSREVPCSAMKGETVPDSLPATPKSPPTRPGRAMNQPCLEVGQREFIQEAQFPFERLRLWLEAGQLPWVLAPLLLTE